MDHIIVSKMALRPITLDDVGKAKVIFEGYIRVKAQRFYAEELARMNSEPKPNSEGISL